MLSSRTPVSRSLKPLAALGLMWVMAGAQAVAVPSSALVSASPATAGTGLNGAYYDTNVYSNGAADAVFASTSTTGTFLAKTINYGGGSSVGDGMSVASFLGSNASNLVGTFTSNLETSLYRFTGYINITSAMDLTPGGTIDLNFMVGSDDGMRLKIGGTTVAEYDSARSFSFTAGTASFSAAGLYAIDLVYWENYGNTGVDFLWQTGLTGGSYQDVATSALYTTLPASSKVPEPATLALTGLGVAALLARRRKAGRA
jgi:hypothetical protein